MKLLTATLVKPPRQVQTKYGTRTVADCIDENGNNQTIWRPENDPALVNLSVNSRLTLTLDSKGKVNLVDNIPSTQNTAKTDNKPQYQGMNPETKREVASYVTEMANLFNFCLKQVDMTVENISSEDRRAIATTVFISCQKKYGL
jgi:hypothetical protein